MPKMIQLRRVPDEVYSIVKARAEQRQMSMSDYLVQELTVLLTPQLTTQLTTKTSPGPANPAFPPTKEAEQGSVD